MKSMVLSMRACLNLPMQVKFGMIWFGKRLVIERRIDYFVESLKERLSLIAFLFLLRYNSRDIEQGGQLFG